MRRCVSASKLINGSIHTNTLRTTVEPLDHPINYSDEFIRDSRLQTHLDRIGWNESNMNLEDNQMMANIETKASVSNHSFNPIVLSSISSLDSSDLSNCETKYNINLDNESNICRPQNISHTFDVLETNQFCDRILDKNFIIRVYAAYDCGLPFGTSVKLQVTLETTVKEIIELVVKHLNSTVLMRGDNKPIYDLNDLNKFCIIAVYSSNVKHLNNDFKNNEIYRCRWNRAKLCIKIRDDNFFIDA